MISQPIVVMGVAGSGKSTVAVLLAQALGMPMLEGDSLHEAANVRRMASGVPLTDSDRQGWLEAIAARLAAAAPGGLVVSCSALTRAARDLLRGGAPGLILVYLSGSRELLRRRIDDRRGHFMPATLLDSQLGTLQPPAPDEHAITCDIEQAPAAIVQHVLGLLRPAPRT